MKNFYLCIYLLLLSLPLLAQQTQIKGRVIDAETEEPLEFVSIFMNNTTYTARTNAQGAFSIDLPPGNYEMVVSYLGYTPIVYQLELDDRHAPLLFKLSALEQVLDEVEVKSKRDEEWYRNLEVFKENFLGKSKLARKCRLLNPEVLIIAFDPVNGLLEVKARDLLQIENPVLGYRISYLLADFKLYTRDRYVTYSGYPSFEEMAGGKWKTRRFDRKRLEAYHGSIMHFVRSLRQQQLEEEGFNLRRLVRKANPDRPTEEEIEQARQSLRERAKGAKIEANDPAAIILSKANLPKMIEFLDKNPVPYQEYLQQEGERVYLAFEDYFQVVYMGEKEEPAYVQSSTRFGTRQPTYQTSVISLRSDEVLLDKTGSIIEPLDIFFEGYWSWEKVGDLLPLDYQPEIIDHSHSGQP